jgi:hypothetical protein
MVSMMGILSGAVRLVVDVRQTVPTPIDALGALRELLHRQVKRLSRS